MLSCKDITEKANEYIDKELSISARVSFRMHLFVCVNCRNYITQLRTTILALGRMKSDTTTAIDESVIEEIVNRVKSDSDNRKSSAPRDPD